MNTGIYCIEHIASGKRYVGSAVDFSQRWYIHKSHLRRNVHHSVYLQRAWNKYGEDAFEFKKLLICSAENRLMYEQRYIDGLNPEYNLAKVAGSQLGYKHTEEARAKIRAARARQVADTAAMHASNKGRKHTPEWIEKTRQVHLGRKRSPEIIARRKAAHIRPMLGKKHSPETLAKMSATQPARWALRRKTQEIQP